MTCLGITALVGTFNLMFETQDVVFGDNTHTYTNTYAYLVSSDISDSLQPYGP